jgi:4-hydroxy-tetrahydrodipicolinate reductase
MSSEPGPVRAAVFGTGRIGREIIKSCASYPGIDVVACVVTDPAKEGRDVGELAGMPPLGIGATTNLGSVLGRPDVDLVFYCGLGDPPAVAAYLGNVAEQGKDVITLTGLIHPVAALGEEGAATLHEQALRGGARVVGAGWNPGFLLDVLPVVWGTSCVRIDRIYAQRVAEMRDWGAGVHDECGIGLPPEQVEDTDSNPLHESVALIADALDIRLDRIDNMHEPYVSAIRREHAGRLVEAGRNAGFHKRSLGISGGKVRIEIEMFGVFCIDPSADSVTEGAKVVVAGDATIQTEARGNWFGDSYPVTAAKAIRAVRPLRSMPPGLYRPDQLPLSGSGQPHSKATPA